MADSSLDCDLRKLAPEDLAIVRRWAEDRLINAITPLDIRLQIGQRGLMAADLINDIQGGQADGGEGFGNRGRGPESRRAQSAKRIASSPESLKKGLQDGLGKDI